MFLRFAIDLQNLKLGSGIVRQVIATGPKARWLIFRILLSAVTTTTTNLVSPNNPTSRM